MIIIKNLFSYVIALILFILPNIAFSEDESIYDTLQRLQNDIKTLERAVYSDQSNNSNNTQNELDQNSEDVLTRHLLKLTEIENQFKDITNRFEEINFKLDKLSNRLSKVQADNQLRFQQLEEGMVNLPGQGNLNQSVTEAPEKILPGSSQPQDLGSISYADTLTTDETQQTQSVDTTSTVVMENFETVEKILPDASEEKQYEFAQSFLKVGDYNTAERAFREFVNVNSDHDLAGSAQYWYAETFRIRQLYTDAATA